jgi:hypothetical protein
VWDASVKAVREQDHERLLNIARAFVGVADVALDGAVREGVRENKPEMLEEVRALAAGTTDVKTAVRGMLAGFCLDGIEGVHQYIRTLHPDTQRSVSRMMVHYSPRSGYDDKIWQFMPEEVRIGVLDAQKSFTPDLGTDPAFGAPFPQT